MGEMNFMAWTKKKMAVVIGSAGVLFVLGIIVVVVIIVHITVAIGLP